MGLLDEAKAKAQELAAKAKDKETVDKASAKTEELAGKIGAKADELAGKAQNAAADRKDQISDAIDKVQRTVDDKTGGKYSDKIAKTADKAQGYVDRLERRPGPGDGEKSDGEKSDGEKSDEGDRP
jgi:uncharacterized protein YjbJ (UPF0337 family)